MLNTGSDTPISKVNEIVEVLEPLALQVVEKIGSNNVLNEVFTKEKVENGNEVEYLLINGANVEDYDKEGKTTLAPRELKKAVLFFNEYKHKVFTNTIYESELEEISLTQEKKQEIVGTIINQIAVERDDYDYAVELTILKDIKDKYSSLNIGTISGTSKAEKCEDLTIKLRNTIDNFVFKNGNFVAYNIDYPLKKVKVKTMLDNIRILMPYTIRNTIDISYLASAYNLSKAEIVSKIITIDTEDNILYVVDRKSVFKYPKYNQLIIEQLNAQGNFRTVFLHQKAMYGFCGLYKFAWIDCSSLVEETPHKTLTTLTLNVDDFDLTLKDSEDNTINSIGIDGNVVYFELENGTYTYQASSTGYQSKTDTFTISGEEFKNVSITLEQETPSTQTITFVVTNEIPFTLTLLDSENNEVQPSGMGEDGIVYELEDGTYSWSIVATGYVSQSDTLTIPSESDTITITLVEEQI